MNKTNRNIFSTKVLFSIGGWTAAHQIKKMLTVKILEVENKVIPLWNPILSDCHITVLIHLFWKGLFLTKSLPQQQPQQKV